jgi:hypothetical protein
MSRHLGLIIGVNQYQDGSFPHLRFAENDARALAQWLVNTKGGKWSPSDVQLVQGQHATRELVESLITQICIHKAEPGDGVLLYFAGHAFVDPLTSEGYLSLFNSQYQDTSTSINLLSFTQQIMARSQAAHILCVFDCFQDGTFWYSRSASPYDSSPLLSPTLLATLHQFPDRLFLCSCRGNAHAQESGEHNLGRMMHSTIVGFCGPASDPSTGTITLSSLYTYLSNTLGEQQKPQLFGQQRLPLTLIGELPIPTPTQSFVNPSSEQSADLSPATSVPGPFSNSQKRTGGLLLKQTMDPATLVPSAPLPTQSPVMSGYPLSSSIEEQRQQQSLQMMDQAQQFFQAQNYEQAFNLVEQVLRLAPTDTSALRLKGQLLGMAGRFPEAGVVIDQLLQIKPDDAIGWSMRAVALTNMGNHQEAFSAIERSLELDAQNPETYALKNTIMANMAFVQSQVNKLTSNKFIPTNKKRSAAAAFALGLGLHLLGLLIGFAGFALLIFLHGIPAPAGLLLISISLTILCVNAARGSFRYGFIHLLLAFLLSLMAAGTLGLAYKVGITAITAQLRVHPSLFVPLFFLLAWLVTIAIIPLVLALGGLISGGISRARKR